MDKHEHKFKLASSTTLLLQSSPNGSDKTRISNITILYCECGEVKKHYATRGIWE
jgi:hypothetical protein